MRFRPGFSVRLAAVAVVAAWGAFLPAPARAYEFVDLATYTTSTTQTVGHACVLYNGTDMSCASTNPYVTSAGLVGIGTSNPTTALEVSGTVSATHFVGDGAGLTGIAPNVPSGLSGSIVYRDEFGVLHASGGFSISSTTGSVGIGAGAPGYLGNNALFIDGSMRTESDIWLGSDSRGIFWSYGTSNIKGNGGMTNGYIVFTTSGAEAMRIVSSGNVGIGTSAPLGKLDIRGQTFFENGNVDGTYGDQVFFGAAPIGYPSTYLHKIRTSHSLDPNIGGMIFSLSDGTETGYRDVLTLKETGNVGIGTNQPKALLDISGTLRLADGGEACDADRAGAIKYSGGVFSFCAGSAWQSLAVAAGGGQADRIVSDSANVVVGNGGTISFTTGGVSGTAYIDTTGRFVAAGVSTTGGISGTTGYFSGNVGIGTASPAATLDINGPVQVGSRLSGRAITGFDTFWIGLGPNGSEPNNLAIGIAAANSVGNIVSQVSVYTSGTLRMLVDPTGNVGIGTMGPQTPLDVSGAIKISGNGSEGCTTTADEGKIRRNPVTGHFQLCAH